MIILEEKPLDVGHIAHSFRRSSGREVVFNYLCAVFPDVKSLVEIAAATGYSKTDILGIMMGYGRRYAPEDSLVALGIVSVTEEDYHGQKVMVFRATSGGLEIKKQIDDYSKQNDLIEGRQNKKKSKRH